MLGPDRNKSSSGPASPAQLHQLDRKEEGGQAGAIHPIVALSLSLSLLFGRKSLEKVGLGKMTWSVGREWTERSDYY